MIHKTIVVTINLALVLIAVVSAVPMVQQKSYAIGFSGSSGASGGSGGQGSFGGGKICTQPPLFNHGGGGVNCPGIGGSAPVVTGSGGGFFGGGGGSGGGGTSFFSLNPPGTGGSGVGGAPGGKP